MTCEGNCETYQQAISDYFRSLYDMLDCRIEHKQPDCDGCKNYHECEKWNAWRDSHNMLFRIAKIKQSHTQKQNKNV